MTTYTNSGECQPTNVASISRELFSHPLFEGQAYSEREAWIWLFTNAAWRAHAPRCRGHVVPLGRGQLIGARSVLAQKWGWGEQKVRTFLKLLENQRMIEVHQFANQIVTVITICNYDRFQLAPNCETKDQTRVQPESNQSPTTLEEGKEYIYSPPRAHANCKPHANLPSNVHQMSDWMAGSIDRSVIRDEATGRLRLDDRLRTEWLERFKGDEQSLDLALIEADGSIQAHSRQPLRPQVERVLARKAADKHDRDARYAKAAASKPAAQRPRERAPDVWEFLQSEAAAAGGAA